jgi:hypothetical protein
VSSGNKKEAGSKGENMKCAWIDCCGLAEWNISLPGKHKMPVCETHVRSFQADKMESGGNRLGMSSMAWVEIRYLIERIGEEGHE